MQIPPNDKASLGLMQSNIFFQMFLISPKSFTIEIAITDTSNVKRRLLFSACSKELIINSLHCRIPLVNFPVGVWVNLSIDVLSFVSEWFKTQSFRAIDYICLSANCKVRRIYSMRSSFTEMIEFEDESLLPKGIMLPKGIDYVNLNLDIDYIKNSEVHQKGKNTNPFGFPGHKTGGSNMNLNEAVDGLNLCGKQGSFNMKPSQIDSNSATVNKARSKSQNKFAKPQTNTKQAPSSSTVVTNGLSSKRHSEGIGNSNRNSEGINKENNENFNGNSTTKSKKINQWNQYDQNGRRINRNGTGNAAKHPVINTQKIETNQGQKIDFKKVFASSPMNKIPPRLANPKSNNVLNKKENEYKKKFAQEDKPATKEEIQDYIKAYDELNENHGTSQNLLNTFNYKHFENDISKIGGYDNPSIQEVVDFDSMIHNNTLLKHDDNNKTNDEGDKMFLYDIEIKDAKMPQKKEEGKKGREQRIIDDIFTNDDIIPTCSVETGRPYTPPMSKMIPVDDNTNVSSIQNLSRINESIIHNHYGEMVYDSKTGKYFNSKTKVYYDFK